MTADVPIAVHDIPSTRSRGLFGKVISLSSKPHSHNGQRVSQRVYQCCSPSVPTITASVSLVNCLTPSAVGCEHQSFSEFPILFPAYTSARRFLEDSHQIASAVLYGRPQACNSDRVSHGLELDHPAISNGGRSEDESRSSLFTTSPNQLLEWPFGT